MPWDQALDIILQAKGLGLRKSGNVHVDRAEGRARGQGKDRSRVEGADRRTRAGAHAVLPAQLHQGRRGRQGPDRASDRGKAVAAPQSRILSPRGSVIFETRTNQLFVTDIPSKLEEMQALIAKIDIPVRQVLIEARIVEADDTFGRSLGVKLGCSDLRGVRGGDAGLASRRRQPRRVGGNLNAVGGQTLQPA